MRSNQILRSENKELRQRNEHLEEEFKMLEMFTNMVDQGQDNAALLREIAKLEDKI